MIFLLVWHNNNTDQCKNKSIINNSRTLHIAGIYTEINIIIIVVKYNVEQSCSLHFMVNRFYKVIHLFTRTITFLISRAAKVQCYHTVKMFVILIFNRKNTSCRTIKFQVHTTIIIIFSISNDDEKILFSTQTLLFARWT